MTRSQCIEQAFAYVTEHPGCAKIDVLRFITHDRVRNPSNHSYIIDSLIRGGWIRATWIGNRYSLSIVRPD